MAKTGMNRIQWFSLSGGIGGTVIVDVTYTSWGDVPHMLRTTPEIVLVHKWRLRLV